eukprot:TRINITY_DN71919_c0_g1_i1.p1 TRINITY_DN71919_c0_g1~~TRINITY_DN71919_c0_g1_i1.p1  ORF type:complete len:315 (+),score=75.03 TRINITY_DN71919_c0_g1_i1:78-1022(+)
MYASQQQTRFAPAPAVDGSAWYGAGEKGLLVRGRRQRMNCWPMLLCVLVPSLFFAGVYYACSFSLRYYQPTLAWAIVAFAFLVVCICGVNAHIGRVRSRALPAEREPSWLCFMFLTLALGWLVAVGLGCYNYKKNMDPYYASQALNQYVDVQVDRVHGQQVMDAGIINFAEGTHLDISQSMGFRSVGTYCVAPIVYGDVKLATYDFWAVGKNCCSGVKADFRCKGFNEPHALGGLRMMSEADRAYYRMAVQQAEATYNIKALHPLFFTWVEDAVSTVDGWREAGHSLYWQGVVTFALVQAFLVATMAMAFSKLA